MLHTMNGEKRLVRKGTYYYFQVKSTIQVYIQKHFRSVLLMASSCLFSSVHFLQFPHAAVVTYIQITLYFKH